MTAISITTRLTGAGRNCFVSAHRIVDDWAMALSDVEWRDFLEIRRLFLSRACVQGMFSTADEKLATELYQRHLPLQRIERATKSALSNPKHPKQRRNEIVMTDRWEENDPDA